MSQQNKFKITNLFIIYSVLIVLPLIFFQTSQSMISVWNNNETFTHGFLIFPISFWLIWQKKENLNQLNPDIELRLLFIIFPILFFWYISKIVGVNITQQFALILLIPSTLWLLLGRKILKVVLFPILFLFFAVPFGQSLIPPLMEFTANFTVFMVKLTGIPIYQDGLFFTLPSGTWSVVEECSGVRYLIASFVLGTLFAYTSYSSKKKRVIFVLISILVPIVANSLRAFGIVMIGHFSGMTLATGVDHLIYGWIFFGVVIFLLFFIGSYWADPLETFKKPIAKRLNDSPSISSFRQLSTQVGIYILFIMTVYALIPNNTFEKNDINIALPDHFSNWQAQDDRSIIWNPIIRNPDALLTKAYLFGEDLVELNIGYFQNQKNGAEAISTMNHIASPLGGKWKKTTGTDLNQNGFYVTETIVKYKGTSVLVWHWYQIGVYETPNPYIAKMFDAYNLIANNRNDAAMITISNIIDQNKESSRENLRDFLSNAAVPINKLIDQ